MDNCKVDDAAIALILQGAPPKLFDWTEPATPDTLRHNVSAGARWEAIKLPESNRSRRNTAPAVRGATEYGFVALERECGTLRGTPGGERNHQLNRSAFNLGQLVASGDLPEQTVVDALTYEAIRIRLRQSEIGPSLRSGLDSGKAKPRVLRT